MKGLERLSDYLGSSASKEPLRRAYLASEIKKRLAEIWDVPIRVVIRDRAVVLYCQSQAQAAAVSQARRRLYAIVGAVTKDKATRKISIRVESATGP